MSAAPFVEVAIPVPLRRLFTYRVPDDLVLEPGDRVVICEDVVTRGASPLEAAEVVRALGAEPVMILPIVDRGGTCGALAEAAGIAFRPLVTALDLGFSYEGP